MYFPITIIDNFYKNFFEIEKFAKMGKRFAKMGNHRQIYFDIISV